MAHGALLRQHSGDPEFASHVMHDYRKAALDPQTRGMLDFTAKLTKDPTSMERSDVQALRDLGLSPNPPKDTDGRREDSGRGWVRELQGRWPGVGVDGRSADGLQSPHRAPKALCGSCDARDGERIRSRGLSRPGWREIAGTLSQLQAGRQAGSGMARSRARARLNCSSQGQRRGRCRVNRRAERVIRPAKAKTRRLRVLVVTVC